MENLMSIPLHPELETEQGKILSEMVQLLNYICVAPTLSRQELATKLLAVAAKCMDTLNDQKNRIQSLEKQHADVNEQSEDANESVQQEERNEEDCEGANESVQHEKEDWEDANGNVQKEERNEENWEGANESLQHEDEDWEDSQPWDSFQSQECEVDRLLWDLIDSTTGQTITSSTSEYKVEDILGEGGFGIVAQCFKKPANETVALKMLKDSSSMEKAKEEVKMLDYLKSLGSEQFNIVSCRDSFIFEGHFCIEFQKLDVSLFDYIVDQESVELKDIRAVLQQMTVALCLLKNTGLIHTDLKPHNIMLVDRTQQPLKVQLIDFGLVMRNLEKWAGSAFQTLLYRAPEVVLGVTADQAIDVWSLGCIAAEMLMGTKLFDISNETELMQHIVSMLGQPSTDMLNRGLNTHKYFCERSSQDWVFKPSGETSPSTDVQQKKLHDLLKVPVAVPTEDDQAVECDRLAFIDLVGQMLNTDASERITPEKILSHPFITLSHLNHENHSSYVKSSIERMKVCNNWSYDGGENAHQPISNTSDCETNMLIIEHPLNSEEEPSVQEVFIRGETGSPKERCLEDLNCSECVSRSQEKNEDERPCNTSACSSPAIENTQSNSDTISQGLIDEVKLLKAAIKEKDAEIEELKRREDEFVQYRRICDIL